MKFKLFLGNACWKCDQMTYDKCSSEGTLEVCEKGDKDCCFVEIRETAQSLQQLCTGCKSKNACKNLQVCLPIKEKIETSN